MNWFSDLINFFSTLDAHLLEFIRNYGVGTYAILFGIVFCETGLVIAPFLPGDSLLFTAGVIAHKANAPLNVWLLFAVFVAAAVGGDNLNYFLGHKLGAKLLANPKTKLFKKGAFEKTNRFLEEHGGKALIMARFIPIVRTFAPFVAGMGAMTYRRFITFSVLAAIVWVGICLFFGYFFGGLPAVRENFHLAILGIIGVSILPPLVEYARHRLVAKRKQQRAAALAAEESSAS